MTRPFVRLRTLLQKYARALPFHVVDDELWHTHGEGGRVATFDSVLALELVQEAIAEGQDLLDALDTVEARVKALEVELVSTKKKYAAANKRLEELVPLAVAAEDFCDATEKAIKVRDRDGVIMRFNGNVSAFTEVCKPVDEGLEKLLEAVSTLTGKNRTSQRKRKDRQRGVTS